MGSGNFNIKKYQVQAKEAKASKNSGFTATSMCDEFNPVAVKTRYSKKGPFNEFRDVITVLIGLDVTGSMDKIPKALLTGRLGSLMLDLKKTYNRPNENLQISFAGIGDAKTDESPLQVTHFESDNRFAQQLKKIWLEGHGGANGGESYNLLWWYAANKTHLNYVEQDNRKGILITIGDDNVHPNLTKGEIQMWLDPKYTGGDISNPVLLNAVKSQYEVYHIIVTDGDAYQYDYVKRAYKSKEQKTAETNQWKKLLGDDHVVLAKSNKVADEIANIVKKHRPEQRKAMINLSEEAWRKENKKHLSDEQWQEVLHYTLCPLTRQFMTSPVVWGNNKKAYEREAVKTYVVKYRQDPLTSQRLTKNLELKPNMNIAQVCLNYKDCFNALSQQRQQRLIQLTLPNSVVNTKNAEVNSNNNNNNMVNNNSQTFFIQNKVAASKQVATVIDDEVQSNLECPISHEIMKDPVMIIATGHTFERQHIEAWFKNHDTDPVSNEVLKDKTLVPNYTVKRLCDKFRDKLSNTEDDTSTEQSINFN